MKTAFGAIRRRVFGLRANAVDFEQRGFRGASAAVQNRLELVGGTFLAGYHLALECDSIPELDSKLEGVELELRGFAFEGAAMGLALLDWLTPWRRDRLRTFLRGAGDAHARVGVSRAPEKGAEAGVAAGCRPNPAKPVPWPRLRRQSRAVSVPPPLVWSPTRESNRIPRRDGSRPETCSPPVPAGSVIGPPKRPENRAVRKSTALARRPDRLRKHFAKCR